MYHINIPPGVRLRDHLQRIGVSITKEEFLNPSEDPLKGDFRLVFEYDTGRGSDAVMIADIQAELYYMQHTMLRHALTFYKIPIKELELDR